MIISDNEKGLVKKWLVNILDKSSDSDTDILADYIVTLLEKDLDKDDLVEYMINELDAFISNSKKFVNDLFVSIENLDYLKYEDSKIDESAILTTRSFDHSDDDDSDNNIRHRSRSSNDDDILTPNVTKNVTITNHNEIMQKDKKRVYESYTPGVPNNHNNFNKRSRGGRSNVWYDSRNQGYDRINFNGTYNNMYEPTFPHYNEWYPPYNNFEAPFHNPPLLPMPPAMSPPLGPIHPSHMPLDPYFPPLPQYPPPWVNPRGYPDKHQRHFQSPKADSNQMTPSMGYLKPSTTNPPSLVVPNKSDTVTVPDTNETTETEKLKAPKKYSNRYNKYKYVKDDNLNNKSQLNQGTEPADKSTDPIMDESNENQLDNKVEMKSPNKVFKQVWKRKGWNQYSLAADKQNVHIANSLIDNHNSNSVINNNFESEIGNSNENQVESKINNQVENISQVENNTFSNEETQNENTTINDQKDIVTQSKLRKPTYAQVVQSKQITEENIIVQQKYEGLKHLRNEVDDIWKKKENLLLTQINKIHDMMKELEKSKESIEKQTLLNNLETKLIDLQSQLQEIKEQRTKGTLSQHVQSDNKVIGNRGVNVMGRAGRGLFGRGQGRFNGRFNKFVNKSIILNNNNGNENI